MFVLVLLFALFPAAGVLADTGGIARLAMDESTLAEAIEAIESSGEIAIGSDIGLTGAISIPAGKSITIRSQGGPYTIYQEARLSTVRHFKVEGGLTLRDVTLDGRESGGGLSVTGGRVILEEGAVLTNCRHHTSGGAVFLADNSTLDIRGGEISFSATSSGGLSGGGIYAQDSEISMNGGAIRGNQSAWGGGVSLSQESTFVMEDGVITQNHATSEAGGGVSVSTHASFTMNGGFITYNEVDTKNAVSRAGGGVFVGLGSHVSTVPTDWARFEMNGGTIAYNSAYSGGGVGVHWVGQVEMNGGRILHNTAMAGGGVGLAYPQYQNDGVSFEMNGGEIAYNTATTNYGGGVWAWDANSTSYTLSLRIGAPDADAEIPKIHHNTAASQGGGMMLISSYGNVQALLYNAEIYGNTAGSLGGGICVYSGSALTMYGGSVYDNTAATSGGGIATYAAGNTLSILGGEITGNTANSTTAGGGGVYLAADTNGVIDGARIAGNTALLGGGLYTDAASTMVSESSIRDNKADNGGGIYVTGTASLELCENTVISNNHAAENGGGIFTEDYDYGNPANEDTYANLLSEESTLFSGNTAGQAYHPPANAHNFPHLGYGRTSLGQSGSWYHPLNNYDINYVDPENPLAVYSVTYEANGGEGTHTDTHLPEGSDYTILDLGDTGITRPGYTFLGWNTQPDGLGLEYAPQDGITIVQNVTLYALWEAVTQDNILSVLYDANGGEGGWGDYKLEPGADYTVRDLDSTGITRSGYTFLGWNTRPDGTGDAYQADDRIVLTQDVTLYAQWQTTITAAQVHETTTALSKTLGDQIVSAAASPKTGDTFHLLLWTAVSGSAALMVRTAVRKKKVRRDTAQ